MYVIQHITCTRCNSLPFMQTRTSNLRGAPTYYMHTVYFIAIYANAYVKFEGRHTCLTLVKTQMCAKRPLNTPASHCMNNTCTAVFWNLGNCYCLFKDKMTKIITTQTAMESIATHCPRIFVNLRV
jgi:hypothetical protein